MDNLITLNSLTIAENYSFKDKRLASHTSKIIQIYQSAVKFADAKNREMSAILSAIKADKSYEKDGFKSVADYAERIFGIKKANAYSLAAAGDVYNDVTASEKLKAFSPSKLAEVASVNRETLESDVSTGKITPSTSQKDLREYARSANKGSEQTEAKPVETYTAFEVGEGSLDLPETEAKTIDEWDAIVLKKLRSMTGIDYETIAIPKVGYIGNDGVETKKKIVARRVYVSRKTYPIIIEYTPYIPKKSLKLSKAASKFTVDELRKMLAEAEAAQTKEG